MFPTLISLSVAPVSYFFCARAGDVVTAKARSTTIETVALLRMDYSKIFVVG
jgi:hypothetical protein